METVTISKKEYNSLISLRELVIRFVGSTDLLPAGAKPAPAKAKKLSNKSIIERFDKRFEERQNKRRNKP